MIDIYLIGQGHRSTEMKDAIIHINGKISETDDIDNVPKGSPVIFLSESPDRGNILLDIISKGYDCLIQSPTSRDAAQISEMLSIATKNRQIVQLIHTHSYSPLYQQFRMALMRIGKLKRITLHYSDRSNLSNLASEALLTLDAILPNIHILDIDQTDSRLRLSGGIEYTDWNLTVETGEYSWKVTADGDRFSVVWDDRFLDCDGLKTEIDRRLWIQQIELERFIQAVTVRHDPNTGLHEAVRISKLIDQDRCIKFPDLRRWTIDCGRFKPNYSVIPDFRIDHNKATEIYTTYMLERLQEIRFHGIESCPSLNINTLSKIIEIICSANPTIKIVVIVSKIRSDEWWRSNLADLYPDNVKVEHVDYVGYVDEDDNNLFIGNDFKLYINRKDAINGGPSEDLNSLDIITAVERLINR
jgi:hypothetical protein